DRRAAERHEAADDDRQLVGRALVVGADPPVVEEAVVGTGGLLGVGVVVEADHRVGVADVDRDEHQAVPSPDGVMSSPMSSTGAELVMAPTEMQSAPMRL